MACPSEQADVNGGADVKIIEFPPFSHLIIFRANKISQSVCVRATSNRRLMKATAVIGAPSVLPGRRRLTDRALAMLLGNTEAS